MKFTSVIFTDNMVLQQGVPISVWGIAEPRSPRVGHLSWPMRRRQSGLRELLSGLRGLVTELSDHRDLARMDVQSQFNDHSRLDGSTVLCLSAVRFMFHTPLVYSLNQSAAASCHLQRMAMSVTSCAPSRTRRANQVHR